MATPPFLAMITALITALVAAVVAIGLLFVSNRKAREAAARAKIANERVELADTAATVAVAAIEKERDSKEVAKQEFEKTTAEVAEVKKKIDAAVEAGNEEVANEWKEYLDGRR